MYYQASLFLPVLDLIVDYRLSQLNAHGWEKKREQKQLSGTYCKELTRWSPSLDLGLATRMAIFIKMKIIIMAEVCVFLCCKELTGWSPNLDLRWGTLVSITEMEIKIIAEVCVFFCRGGRGDFSGCMTMENLHTLWMTT